MKKDLTNKVVQTHLKKLVDNFKQIEDYEEVSFYINKYYSQGFPVYSSLKKLNEKLILLGAFSIN